jgi:hypothetical protein
MDQLETLIQKFEILIAYQRINPPDNSGCVNPVKNVGFFLSGNAITGHYPRHSQHGNGLG